MAYEQSLNKQEIIKRNNVRIEGNGKVTLLLAHGFGCDQTMWRFLAPYLVDNYRLITFDYVGSGRSDMSAFKPELYQSLEGYARDVIDVCDALELDHVTFIGHSVSATIGMLASIVRPELFSNLIMLSPSPCFINYPPDYHGGFERQDLEDLLDLMDKNYLGWASFLAPLVMGADASEALVNELENSFCTTHPVSAGVFARATFFSDYRHALADVSHPTLILQSAVDSLSDVEVGRYTHNNIPGSQFKVIEAQGHSLHMAHPKMVSDAISVFLSR